MEQNETMRVSIENVRNIVNNSILLLRDADLLLSKEGFSPIYGNTIGCEPSKNINQSSDQPSSFFPQYMSRYYSRSNGVDQSKILGLNIQFYHFNYDTFSPAFLAGKCKLKEGVTRVEHWWLKYCAFETGIEFKTDGTVFPYEDDEVELSFWGKDLYRFNGIEDLQREIIDKLLVV